MCLAMSSTVTNCSVVIDSAPALCSACAPVQRIRTGQCQQDPTKVEKNTSWVEDPPQESYASHPTHTAWPTCRVKPGYIDEAKNGLLFLDEIQDLPKPAQRQLVRFLQDPQRRFRPVGGKNSRSACVPWSRLLARHSFKLGTLGIVPLSDCVVVWQVRRDRVLGATPRRWQLWA